MKHFFTIAFLLFAISFLHAQLVTTIAGQVEISGSNDGAPFDATFNNPHGIAVDLNGVSYVADRWNHTIRKIDKNGTVSTIAGTPGLAGDVDGVGGAALFNEPWGLCVDNQGNIFVADTRNDKIRKITPDGIVSTLAGTGNYGTTDGIATSATFGNPTGIETDNQGNLYIADHLTHIIRKIDSSGNVSTLAGEPYQGGFADGIGNAARFMRPYGLTLDLDGNILVADEWNHRIRKITPLGVVTTVAGDGLGDNDDGDANTASFNFPWDLTVDSTGNIYVADGYNYTIRKITSSGIVSTYAGTTGVIGGVDGLGDEASFSGTTALAISPVTDEIYVGDAYNNLVRKVTNLNQGVSLILTVGDIISCEGEMVQLTAQPNVFSTYHFYLDNQPVQSNSNPVFETSMMTPGVHSLQVVVSENGNNFTSNPIMIEVVQADTPSITTVGSTDFFEGDSVILVASFGTEYFWSTGETTATITVTEAGVYSVEVIDGNGCAGRSELVEVTVQEIPEAATITVQGDTIICTNESTVLVSSEPNNNQWLKDSWAIAGETDAELVVTSSGIYQVQVTDQNGIVTLSEPVEIEVLPPFEVDFLVSNIGGTTDDVFEFQISQSNITSASWNFGDDNTSTEISPTYQYSEEGIYHVTLIAESENGCLDTLTKNNYITVNNSGNFPTNTPSDIDIFVPNAFTPNEDGVNDILYVRGSSVQEMTFLIFNQWGEEIFKSFSQDIGWDGTIQNGKVQNGNYVYVLDYVDDEGVRRKISGNITVLR